MHLVLSMTDPNAPRAASAKTTSAKSKLSLKWQPKFLYLWTILITLAYTKPNVIINTLLSCLSIVKHRFLISCHIRVTLEHQLFNCFNIFCKSSSFSANSTISSENNLWGCKICSYSRCVPNNYHWYNGVQRHNQVFLHMRLLSYGSIPHNIHT